MSESWGCGSDRFSCRFRCHFSVKIPLAVQSSLSGSDQSLPYPLWKSGQITDNRSTPILQINVILSILSTAVGEKPGVTSASASREKQSSSAATSSDRHQRPSSKESSRKNAGGGRRQSSKTREAEEEHQVGATAETCRSKALMSDELEFTVYNRVCVFLHCCPFLVADTRLNTLPCPSVGPSVGPPVRNIP